MGDSQNGPDPKNGQGDGNKEAWEDVDWSQFFGNQDLKTACENYAKPVDELAFNPFVLMSDTYKRENFHSDILKAILLPTGTHDEGTRFFNLFCDLLIEAAEWKTQTETEENENLRLDLNGISENIEKIRACGDVSVTRETGHTDIAICGSLSEKSSAPEGTPSEKDWVIIIENKINGAVDQERQLPRYSEYWEKKEKTVLVFVYIVLTDSTAMPDINQWTPDDKTSVFPKLITLPAYNENVSFSLFNFLRRCELDAKKFSSVALFRQYAALMKEQAGGNMSEKKKTIETVISAAVTNKFPLTALRDMLVDVSKNRADKLKDLLIDKMNDKSLIGRPKDKTWTDPGKWTEPDVTKEYAVYVDSPEFDIEGLKGQKFTFAIDVPFHDLDALGVVTFFVRDADGKPSKKGLDNLSKEVISILTGKDFSPSSGGWINTRYDDKWKWRERKTNVFYPCDADLDGIANRILDLIRALNACDDFKKLIKREMTLEVPVVNDSPQA